MAGAVGVVIIVIVFAVLAGLLRALLKAKSEGARRVRVVLGGLGLLVLAWVLFTIGGPGLLAAVTAVAGAAWWIARGFKK